MRDRIPNRQLHQSQGHMQLMQHLSAAARRPAPAAPEFVRTQRRVAANLAKGERETRLNPSQGGFGERFAGDIMQAMATTPTGVYRLGRAGVLDAPDIAKLHPPRHLLGIAHQGAQSVRQDLRHPLRHPGYTVMDALALAGGATAYGREAAATARGTSLLKVGTTGQNRLLATGYARGASSNAPPLHPRTQKNPEFEGDKRRAQVAGWWYMRRTGGYTGSLQSWLDMGRRKH